MASNPPVSEGVGGINSTTSHDGQHAAVSTNATLNSSNNHEMLDDISLSSGEAPSMTDFNNVADIEDPAFNPFTYAPPLLYTNADQLNMELDALDAEIMGESNLQLLASEAYSDSDQEDDEMVDQEDAESLESNHDWEMDAAPANEAVQFNEELTQSLHLLEADQALPEIIHLDQLVAEIGLHGMFSNLETLVCGTSTNAYQLETADGEDQSMEFGAHEVELSSTNAFQTLQIDDSTPSHPQQPQGQAIASHTLIEPEIQPVLEGGDVIHDEAISQWAAETLMIMANELPFANMAIEQASPAVSDDEWIMPHPDSYLDYNLMEFVDFIGVLYHILADLTPVDERHNPFLVDFLHDWSFTERRGKGPNTMEVTAIRHERPEIVRGFELNGEAKDIQGVDWTKLGVTRKAARDRRRQRYTNYTTLDMPSSHAVQVRRQHIRNTDSFYKFTRLNLKAKIGPAHFQLRNCLALTSRNNVFYSVESHVMRYNPDLGKISLRMDLSDPVIQSPSNQPFGGVQISTLAAAHNVIVAGGYHGEYALIRADAPMRAKHVEGLITDNPNPITNHCEIHLSRHSGMPQAIFASNDKHLRVLDCYTNTFTSHQEFEIPINGSAISPDNRLRVLVGDDTNVLICNSDTGEIYQRLSGHEDYGFACAWADNGWHVATGNQDRLIKIWDARMWTNSSGAGKPIHSISTTIAGARSLKFSPVGSGKRVLVAMESADIMSIIDAETYLTKQEFDFFGETCGIDFTADGSRLFLGVHDPDRGGILEFEKCGFGQYRSGGHPGFLIHNDWHKQYDERKVFASPIRMEAYFQGMSAGYDWLPEEVIDDDARLPNTATRRRRAAAFAFDGPMM